MGRHSERDLGEKIELLERRKQALLDRSADGSSIRLILVALEQVLDELRKQQFEND